MFKFIIYYPAIILSVVAITAYISFLITAFYYNNNQRFENIDWSMWLARLISASLVGLVVLLIILKVINHDDASETCEDNVVSG